jgi:hypothetical protein
MAHNSISTTGLAKAGIESEKAMYSKPSPVAAKATMDQRIRKATN